MYITFKNQDEYNRVKLDFQNQTYMIAPLSELQLPSFDGKAVFAAETLMPDFSDDLKEANESDKRSERIIGKLAGKLLKNLDKCALFAKITYELEADGEDVVILFEEGAYSVCDGIIADDFFDMVPVLYAFARAEAVRGKLKVTNVQAVNLKQYRKLARRFLLFLDWGLILPNLLFFIPKYIVLLYFSSQAYISRLIKGFYQLSFSERTEKFRVKEEKFEKDEKKSGCLIPILKVILFLAALIGICVWAMSGESEIIVSQDYSSVEYYDEVFVRTDTMPSDVKKVFLESFYADYPEDDGSYDSYSHYCYIYEDSAGNRYMWLQTDYDNVNNRDKQYSDYENPLIYKSVNEN